MSQFPPLAPQTTELHAGNAYWMARLAKEIYRSVPDTGGKPDDAAILASLQQDDPGFLSVDGFNNQSSQAALIEHKDFYCLTFRGTDELADWLDNLNVLAIEEPYGEFHSGFFNAVEDIWQPLMQLLKSKRWQQPKPLMLTGHSLGGAMASIATARLLEIDIPFRSVYTFGQPRAMTDDTAEEFNYMCQDRYFRFHNNNDLVTRIPARLAGYSHVGSYLYISDEKEIYKNPSFWFRFMDYIDGAVDAIGEQGVDMVEDHSIDDYISAIHLWDFKAD